LHYARERELLTTQEEQVLLATARAGIAKASDLKGAMPGISDAQRTYQIRKLVERRMLAPIREGARQYTVGFSNSYLIRGVIRALSAEGFIPDALNRPR
jgi:Fic family protein